MQTINAFTGSCNCADWYRPLKTFLLHNPLYGRRILKFAVLLVCLVLVGVLPLKEVRITAAHLIVQPKSVNITNELPFPTEHLVHVDGSAGNVPLADTSIHPL